MVGSCCGLIWRGRWTLLLKFCFYEASQKTLDRKSQLFASLASAPGVAHTGHILSDSKNGYKTKNIGKNRGVNRAMASCRAGGILDVADWNTRDPYIGFRARAFRRDTRLRNCFVPLHIWSFVHATLDDATGSRCHAH